MKLNNKKFYLSHILIFFIMLLFATGLTMNVFFCGNYNLYELFDHATVIETRAISENVVSNENDDDTPHFKAFLLSVNKSHTETITKNLWPRPIIAAIPQSFRLFLFIMLVFLYFFSTLFRLLPDDWTLINQKVRLDD